MAYSSHLALLVATPILLGTLLIILLFILWRARANAGKSFSLFKITPRTPDPLKADPFTLAIPKDATIVHTHPGRRVPEYIPNNGRSSSGSQTLAYGRSNHRPHNRHPNSSNQRQHRHRHREGQRTGERERERERDEEAAQSEWENVAFSESSVEAKAGTLTTISERDEEAGSQSTRARLNIAGNGGVPPSAWNQSGNGAGAWMGATSMTKDQEGMYGSTPSSRSREQVTSPSSRATPGHGDEEELGRAQAEEEERHRLEEAQERARAREVELAADAERILQKAMDDRLESRRASAENREGGQFYSAITRRLSESPRSGDFLPQYFPNPPTPGLPPPSFPSTPPIRDRSPMGQIFRDRFAVPHSTRLHTTILPQIQIHAQAQPSAGPLGNSDLVPEYFPSPSAYSPPAISSRVNVDWSAIPPPPPLHRAPSPSRPSPASVAPPSSSRRRPPPLPPPQHSPPPPPRQPLPPVPPSSHPPLRPLRPLPPLPIPMVPVTRQSAAEPPRLGPPEALLPTHRLQSSEWRHVQNEQVALGRHHRNRSSPPAYD